MTAGSAFLSTDRPVTCAMLRPYADKQDLLRSHGRHLWLHHLRRLETEIISADGYARRSCSLAPLIQLIHGDDEQFSDAGIGQKSGHGIDNVLKGQPIAK